MARWMRVPLDRADTEREEHTAGDHVRGAYINVAVQLALSCPFRYALDSFGDLVRDLAHILDRINVFKGSARLVVP